MELFWRQGYLGTSLSDVVERTGVNRGSLYTVFRDKHELFLQALAHYRHAVVPRRLGILERPGGGLEAIEAYFRAVEADLLEPGGKRGCLMVNSATELAATDSAVALEVRRHLERLQAGFETALTAAVAAADLSETTDVQATARFLTGVAQGLMVIGKAMPDRKVLRDLYRPALQTLR